MKVRHAAAFLALVTGAAANADAADLGLRQSRPAIVHPAAWHHASFDFECDRCIDVKHAPAPTYRRSVSWRAQHRRARHGHVVSVRG